MIRKLKNSVCRCRDACWRVAIGGMPITEKTISWSDLQWTSRMTFAVSRAAASSPLRKIDPTELQSWEFSGCSQNGEDGVIDFLSTLILQPTRYFIEIGASDGIENNTAFLAAVKRWSGIMVEADAHKAAACRRGYRELNWGLQCVQRVVTPENVSSVLSLATTLAPDVFSLDIDSVDMHVARAMFARGFTPAIVVVEYNSVFGPELACTVPYAEGFDRFAFHPSGMYYGVSIMGWRHFLEPLGYAFLGVDTNGVNGFFVRRAAFDEDFVVNVKPVPFVDNYTHRLARYAPNGAGYYAAIAHLPIEFVEPIR